MEFRILGPLEAFEGGVSLALGGPKQRALLAMLLLQVNEVVSTDGLIDGLWEVPPAKPTKAVQVYVSRLRKALGGAMPASQPPGYVMKLSPEQLDLARFRVLRELARRDSAGNAEKLEQALALWRGPALAEFLDEPFARAERLRLEEERLGTLEERIEAELALGRHAAVAGELEALVALHPLRERLRAQQMLALYRCGRQADALAAYREGRARLVEELGLEPGRQLQELERAILRQDSTLELSTRAAGAPTPDTAGSAARSEPTREEREERKVVSVLFAEIVGLSDQSGPAEPEDVRARVGHFSEMAKLEIERFGGTVESLIGDALMAVFGAPVAHEDDAERAVRAALGILGSIRETDAELNVRISVDTGIALVSLDAHPQVGSVIAGEVVNSGRRLLTAAPANGVVVGGQTYSATREAIEYRESTPTDGKRRTVIWEAVSARPRRGIDLRREPSTPLVGRERELDLLVSTFARASQERSPQLITLVGVAGIGKSRLVFELSKRLEQDRGDVVWLKGRCLPYGEGVSFWALGEIVKAYAGILESDHPEQADEKLRGAVARVIPAGDEAAWVSSELRRLVGAGGELRGDETPSGSSVVWRRFLEGLAELGPLVLVLEDLHWADDGLLEFIDELAVRVRDASLILCTARPELLERRPEWGGGKANALTISLRPLSDQETATLVRAVPQQPALEAGTLQLLLRRAGGNPFYAEQFLRVLAEVGSLEDLPETVHGVIAARLDGLLPEEKVLLQDAAVVGKVFWRGAIESIGEVARPQADEILTALERKEFVQRDRRSSVAGDTEYAFGHVLLRDVAYAQIPRAARAEKHRRVAGWIESLGRPDDHAEMLAHHYSRALEYTRAAGHEDPALSDRARLALRAAGDRAFAVASYAAAAHFYGAALDSWPEADPDRMWLLVRAGHARHAADGTGIDLLEQGFDQLCSAGNLEGAAEVAVELARRFWLVGERDAARRYIERALQLVEGRGDSRARAYALVERAAYHMNATEHPQAIRLVREALPLTESLGLDDLHIRALDVLGTSRVSLGDTAGLDDSRQAISLARKRNLFSRLIVAELNLQSMLISLGQVAASSEVLSDCRDDVESYGTSDQRNWLCATEAHEAVFQGRWEDASHTLDARLAEAESGVTHYSDPLCQALRAGIALAGDNLRVASADSARALERARRTKDPQLLAPTLAMRAIVRLAEGRRDEASSFASEVLEQGAVLIPALLDLHPTVTPVELAWLIRDLRREAEFVPALESAPPTPWREAARAITGGDLAHGVELVAGIGAPSVTAYTRLRTGEELVRAGRTVEAREHLEPSLAFFTEVGAARYLAQIQGRLADLS